MKKINAEKELTKKRIVEGDEVERERERERDQVMIFGEYCEKKEGLLLQIHLSSALLSALGGGQKIIETLLVLYLEPFFERFVIYYLLACVAVTGFFMSNL